VFASFFNQDFKGACYLVGLIVTGFFVKMVQNTGITDYFKVDENNKGDTCNAFNFNVLGFQASNDLPMSQVVFGFTYAYLLTIMYYNQLFLANIPTIVFFPVVIMFDLMWNISNTCHSIMQLLIAGGLGALGGWGWARFLKKTKNEKYMYFSFVGGNDTSCTRPSQQSFKCSMKLISKENEKKSKT